MAVADVCTGTVIDFRYALHHSRWQFGGVFFSFPMRRAGCVRPHAKIKLVRLDLFGKLLQKGVAKMEVIAVNNELW